MGWRIVKQPSGLYARFSEVVDTFTDIDMTRGEAVDLCREHMGAADAEQKVMAADRDRPIVGQFPSRWMEALDVIRMIHGPDDLEVTLQTFGDGLDRTSWPPEQSP